MNLLKIVSKIKIYIKDLLLNKASFFYILFSSISYSISAKHLTIAYKANRLAFSSRLLLNSSFVNPGHVSSGLEEFLIIIKSIR